MNKLEGFFYLNEINIPTVPWREYTGVEEFDDGLLWTVRSALLKGEDSHLPRLVGATGQEAKNFAQNLYHCFKNKGMVIYYPYFIAEKSGTMEVNSRYTLIEAVEADLWNLVTQGKPKVSLKKTPQGEALLYGDGSFLSSMEKEELYAYIPAVSGKSREVLSKGSSLLLEWSYAYRSNVLKEPVGKRTLVFYEIKEIQPIT